MATLQSIITFTGKLGNIIGYNRGGRHFLRMRPQTVRQTEGTRRAAQRFGAASRKGGLIRRALLPEIDFHCDGGHVNRLTKTILDAGKNHHAGITGFRFNLQTGIERFFTVCPTFSAGGKLQIPAQALPAMGGADRMEVKLIATRIDFASRHVTATNATLLNIDLAQPFEGADMEVSVPGPGTLVIAMQVRVFIGGLPSANRKFMAADILGVINDRAPEVVIPMPPKRQTTHRLLLKTSGCTARHATRQPIIQRE